MSNRSDKLLLELANSIEHRLVRFPTCKLSGDTMVPINYSLLSEIITWARGYKESLAKVQHQPKPTGLSEDKLDHFIEQVRKAHSPDEPYSHLLDTIAVDAEAWMKHDPDFTPNELATFIREWKP